ncbi:MAG: MFS transporter, partial [Candidatus Hodarchaeota archaeon]
MPSLSPKSPLFFQTLSLIAIAAICFGFHFITLLRVIIFYSNQGLLTYSYIISLIAFSGLFFRPFVGCLSDSSRKHVFLIATLCYAVSPLMLFYPENLPLVSLLSILEGIGDAAHASSIRMSFFDLSSNTHKKSINSAWYLSFVEIFSTTGAAFFLGLIFRPNYSLQFYFAIFITLFIAYTIFGFAMPNTVNKKSTIASERPLNLTSSLKQKINGITGIQEMSNVQKTLIFRFILYFIVIGVASGSLSSVSIVIFYERLAFSNMSLMLGALGLASLIGSFIVVRREKKDITLSTSQLIFLMFSVNFLGIAYLFTSNP